MAMHLALVGMSNAGKSYWAARLAREARFQVLGIDQAIARRLQLDPDPGGAELALASWMGLPSAVNYPEREAEYLALEAEELNKALDCLTQSGKYVIDTTGSVIHLNPVSLQRLRSTCHVLWLSLSAVTLDEMIGRFQACPKPLIWSGFYQPESGEAEAAALERCYPLLLNSRVQLYSQLAHQELDGGELRRNPPDINEFIRIIQEECHAL